MAVAFESTFVASVTVLEEREAAKIWRFVEKYMDDKTRPSISLERVTHTKNSGLWSARVDRDLRAIVYRDGPDEYLLHVGHHDAAYAWARRRRIDVNAHTGRMQIFVEHLYGNSCGAAPARHCPSFLEYKGVSGGAVTPTVHLRREGERSDVR
jgi:hypothetical protein